MFTNKAYRDRVPFSTKFSFVRQIIAIIIVFICLCDSCRRETLFFFYPKVRVRFIPKILIPRPTSCVQKSIRLLNSLHTNIRTTDVILIRGRFENREQILFINVGTASWRSDGVSGVTRIWNITNERRTERFFPNKLPFV